MNSSHSTNDLLSAKKQIEELQRSTLVQLGMTADASSISSLDDPDAFEAYLKTNPEFTSEQRKSFSKSRKSPIVSGRGDIAILPGGGANSLVNSLLVERVDQLRDVWPVNAFPAALQKVAFGVIPGGVLDAYSFRADGVDAYGVVVPEGLFFLLNLFTKLVILLQPWTLTPKGPVYMPTASGDQFSLASHPYVKFRQRDVVKTYFTIGDPVAALPYRTALPGQDYFTYLLKGAELFVIAHEVAHVALGHLEHFDGSSYDLNAEYEADALAFDVLLHFFDKTMNYGKARASLCQALFLSVTRLWESGMQYAFRDSETPFRSATHPTFKQRLTHLRTKLEEAAGATPGSYIYIHNAIRIATEFMSERELPAIIDSVPSSATRTKEPDPQKVGQELHVRAVLVSRLLQRGDTLVINTELVDAEKGSQLWGTQYKRELADVLTVQEEISRDISENLRLRLTGEEKQRLRKHSTENPEAYQLYLKGRYYSNKASLEGLKKSVDYFQQAIEKDPGNALAYAGLANSYGTLGIFSYLQSKDAFPKAKAAALKALEIDGSLAEAHAALGITKYVYDWDWSGAEAELRRAIELNPSSVDAHRTYAQYLTVRGRIEEGFAEDPRALELDPLSPQVIGTMAYHSLAARQYDDSIAQYKKAMELDSGLEWVHAQLSWAYGCKGDYVQAIAENEKAGTEVHPITAENQLNAAGLGWIYALAGRRGDARNVIVQFKELESRADVDYYNVAVVLAGLGDKDRPFEALERAYAERSGSLAFINADPFLKELRSDARYQDPLSRIGLSQ